MNIKDPRYDVPIWNSGCAALMCTIFAALLRSMRAYRPAALNMRATRVGFAGLATAPLLAAFGYAGAAWLRTGSALGAGMFALLLAVLPWSRIPMCCNRLPLAGALTLLGGALLFAGAPRAPLPLLAPAWMLWLAAVGAWMRLILLKHRKSRALAGYPASG